ncbi:Phytosulfokine [Zostera marina]|uniref:Phytosulfokine n=1 Tax=Zostera marina TaxID=29655 RepID=A0A0K9Q2D1_ZOSMR|nr:Phytosulfokine [Zostera marina]
MSKATALVMCLMLSIFLAEGTRPVPKDTGLMADDVGIDTSCVGINEDECLMRRTLVAHVDYIYTQGKKKSP